MDTELLARLEAHARLHDDLAMHDAEQAQWAADLRAALKWLMGERGDQCVVCAERAKKALRDVADDAALWEERARHLGWRDEHGPTSPHNPAPSGVRG